MNEIEFCLEGSAYIELHQLLKATGVCASGGMAKNVIGAAEVMVDGNTETRKRAKIYPGQSVTFADTCISVASAAGIY